MVKVYCDICDKLISEHKCISDAKEAFPCDSGPIKTGDILHDIADAAHVCKSCASTADKINWARVVNTSFRRPA